MDRSTGHAHFLVYRIFVGPCLTNKWRKWREIKCKHSVFQDIQQKHVL